MEELISLLLIGVALSMDTFSLSLGLGMFNFSNKMALKLALIVGFMHFIMPFLGMVLGSKLISLLDIQYDFLLSIILLAIAIQMLIDIVRKEDEKINFSILGMLAFALGVSLDSFSLGLGIKAITNNIYLAMLIFAFCSAVFTFVGVELGRFANKVLGIYASIVGALILIGLALMYLL